MRIVDDLLFSSKKMTAHEELKEAAHGQEFESRSLLVTACRKEFLRKIADHTAPESTIGCCEKARDAHNHKAEEDENLIRATCREPPVPHVDGRKMRHPRPPSMSREGT